MENNFFIVFNYVLTYILMVHTMIIMFFHLPYFHVLNNALFLHSTLVLSFKMDAVQSPELNYMIVHHLFVISDKVHKSQHAV